MRGGECAEELAYPVTALVRKLLSEGCWPECWKLHWLIPIYKRKAVSDPGNYRGVHLTSVLSKVVERVLNKILSPYLKEAGAFGESQFAFQAGRSCNDLVAALVCSWIETLDQRKKVGLYLSDISGVFDKVETRRLMAKLRATGLNDTLLTFLEDYLSARSAFVLVGGKKSAEFKLENTVFQGTVLGPSLWNAFFKDVRSAAQRKGGRESKFADDLSVTKVFEKDTPNKAVFADLKLCQQDVHKWGETNRVEFDPKKEELVVLHHRQGEGPEFRLLGPVFDPKLQMHTAVRKTVNKARPKLQALLHTRRFYSIGGLVKQFKTHLLCVLEAGTAAVYHAADSTLEPLDRVLFTFLRELELSSEEAFLEYNLASLNFRRDVAMLGLLHKCALGVAHPWLRELFPLAPPRVPTHNTKHQRGRHNRQIAERCKGNFLELTRRSVFGLVRVYNFLPQDVVQLDSVKDFQKALTEEARKNCRRGGAWETMYSPRCVRQG